MIVTLTSLFMALAKALLAKCALSYSQRRLKVRFITKAARGILCAVHYQQDGACMALVPSILCMHGHDLSNEYYNSKRRYTHCYKTQCFSFVLISLLSNKKHILKALNLHKWGEMLQKSNNFIAP